MKEIHPYALDFGLPKIFQREQPKRLSVEEMNKIVLERIPLEERLRSVYLPIIAMDCACYLVDDLLVTLKSQRKHDTRKNSRGLRACSEGYRGDNYSVMRSELYQNLSETTKGFYNSLATDMFIYQLQYGQALLNRRMHLDTLEEERIMTLSYIIRDIAQYVIALDREFSRRISDLLGKNIHYTTEDNGHCKQLIVETNKLLDLLGVPKDLSTPNTELSLNIFKNKLKGVKI